MKKLKSYFETPKKALVSTLILLAALACLGTATVLTVNAIAQSGAIGQEKAQYLACADAGVDPASAQVFQCDFEFDHGQFVYEIEFAANGAEYEYWVKASDGTIVKKEVDHLAAGTTQAPAQATTLTPTAEITLEDAKAVALSDAGLTADQVVFTEERMDMDDGVSRYELDFHTDTAKYEYEINAADGVIHSKSKETYAATQPETTQPATQPTTGTNGQLTVDEAKAAALSDAGVAAADATFTKAELDYDDGVAYYDLEFHTASYAYDYEVNAETCAIRERNQEAFYSAATQTGQSVDDVEEAKAIAVACAGVSMDSATFTKAKLERDDGLMVYEIEFYCNNCEHEVKINAANGAVLEYDHDCNNEGHHNGW